MRIKSIVYDGVFNVVDQSTLAIKYGEFLAKTLYVYIGVVEKILTMGYEPLNQPIIPGSSGVVRLIEDPSGRYGESSGKVAVVSPIGVNGVLGLDLNGLLASYTGVYEKYIYEYVVEPKPLHAIKPYVAYAVSIGERVVEPVLIIGCEIVSIALAMYLSKARGIDPLVICSRVPKYLKYTRIKFVNNVGDIAREYCSVVVDFEKYSLIHEILSRIKYRKLLITSFSRIKYLPVKPGYKVDVEYVDSINSRGDEHIDYLLKILQRYVRVVKIKDVDEARDLIPPRGLGLVLSFID